MITFRRRLLAVYLALFTVLISPVVHAANFVVTTTEELASGSLFSSISQANAAGGTHTITFDPSVEGTISMNNTLNITCNLTITGPGASVLTLQTGFARIFTIAPGATVSISGLTMDGGRTQGPQGASGTFQNAQPTSGGTGTGGGILNSGSLTLTACVLSNNRVLGGNGGGGFTSFGQNGAAGGDAHGGAVYSDGPSLTVVGCTFFNNKANDGFDGGRGGAGSFNFAGASGSAGVGGPGGNARGGAIYVAAGTCSITNSTFASNQAKGGDGGAGGINPPAPTLPGGNGGNGLGGAIFAAVPVTITSCTIVNGLAQGGSVSAGGTAGMGLAGGLATGSVMTVGNTLVAKNNARNTFNSPLFASDVGGAFSSSNFNLIGAVDGSSGFNGAADITGSTASPVDPLLDPQTQFSGPNNNGGPTPTFVLGRSSPAIDKGKVLNGASLDQRGLARAVNQNDGDYPNAVGGDGSDIGAVEVQGSPNFRPELFVSSAIAGTTGSQVFFSIAASDSDSDPLTFIVTAGTLPNGLTLDANTGLITGTVATPVNTSITVVANDGIENSLPSVIPVEIKEVPSLVVNTVSDAASDYDNVTSLREAIQFAYFDGQTTPVTFDAAIFAARKTIVLTQSIVIQGDVDIVGPTAGVTLSGAGGFFNLMAVYSGTLNIQKLTFTSSAAQGGAAAFFGGNMTFSSCTFKNMTGGALYNSGGTVTLTNCTLADNSVVGGGGGAIYQNSGTITVLNSTLTRNSANFANGGAINVAGGTATLGNSIVAGNSVSNGGAHPDISGTVTSLGYNLIGDATGATITGDTTGDQLDVEPDLDPAGLSYNEGPTETVRILSDSAAIDQGKALGSVTTDQRGIARPFEDATIANASGGDGSDIGAFEVQAVAKEIAVELEDGTDLQDGLSTIDLGATEANSTTEVLITIKNKGGLPLALSGTPKVALSGTSASLFAVSNQPAPTLAAFSSATFRLTFTPTSIGVKTAAISIASDDSDEASFDIALTATVVETATVPPILALPRSNGGIFPQATVKFTLPEAALAGSVKIDFIQQIALSPNAPDVFVDGTVFSFPLGTAFETAGTHTVTIDTATAGMPVAFYNVTLSYQDLASHTAATATNTKVRIRPTAPVLAGVFASGSVVPGAGTHGLPADAKIATFNTPAIDDAGNVAYLAKWASVTAKSKGTGLFLNNTCLATVGEAVTGVSGAKFKSFTDPVVNGATVVSIAGFTGVPGASASAVMSGSPLAIVARAGAVAPDISGATPAGTGAFKKFNAVSNQGNAVALLAQLSGGTGAGKVTGNNDMGLWIKDGAAPLKLVVREGQTIGAKTIKTLVSFMVGNGSPGQGRGWVTRPSGPAVLALATFTDKTQAIISAGIGGTATIFSETGVNGTDGGPTLANATFASYGFPAANSNDTSAFLASMTVGAGGVTKADARGIFLSDGTGAYTPIARVGKPSGVSGSNFSLLKDPVLSSDDGLAFLATLKGGTIKGLPASTLWWQPAGGSLTLLAQAGTALGVDSDLPGAQIKSFTSLAIAGDYRGPIFVAKLVPNKTNVTAATANSVWACDLAGEPRLLFRTGVPNAIVTGKTLKSFSLLTATVGNIGVTRSFNDTQKVVWLATFTDKTQAIVTTEVP
jgi:hypothetical protein